MNEVRTIDGSGNNLENPSWGKAGEALLRNIPPAYEGLGGPSGSDRPNPKLISDIVCRQDAPVENAAGLSDYMWGWGQFLDHELDLSPSDRRESFPIPIPQTDRFIPFSRSVFDRSTGTGIGNPRQQLNLLSSYIDAGNVYGTNNQRAAVLRAFDGSGKLKTSDSRHGPLLPRNPGGVPNDPEAPPAMARQFFLAGDVRSNEHVVLACLHTLFVREHNRLCERLQYDRRLRHASPVGRSYGGGPVEEASDEEIYQHARRIVIGIMQVITYNEFLPALLGSNALRPYTGYNQDVNATIANIFSTGCYRLGHSMLSPLVQRAGLESIAFEDTFFSNVPRRIEADGVDAYLAGAASQKMQEIDTKAVDSVRVHLFQSEETPLIDLAALNIQRGRDHGLPDYNTCRAAYGLSPKEDFRDISSDPDTQLRLKQAYDGDISLVDPWIGGLAEDHHHDAVVGEFFFHVLKDQFERIRDGDRFWFENDLALSDAEREEIARTTLADVIERNTGVTGLQPNVFRVPEPGAPAGGAPVKKKASRKRAAKKKVAKKKAAKKKVAKKKAAKKKVAKKKAAKKKARRKAKRSS